MVKICRVSYDKNKDEFSTWIYCGSRKYPKWEDFDFEFGTKCVRGMINSETKTDGANYIHFEILTRIRQAIDLGYKVQFMDRPATE